jgi:hypothetical protein
MALLTWISVRRIFGRSARDTKYRALLGLFLPQFHFPGLFDSSRQYDLEFLGPNICLEEITKKL